MCILCITNVLSYYIGSHSWFIAADLDNESFFYPHSYNTKESLNYERKYCSAWIELCYQIKEKYPDLWFDSIMPMHEYRDIVEINKGDFEDFY